VKATICETNFAITLRYNKTETVNLWAQIVTSWLFNSKIVLDHMIQIRARLGTSQQCPASPKATPISR